MPLTLLSSGSNAHGQLANNTLDDSYTFKPCYFAGTPPGTLPLNTQRILDMAHGANHTVILLERLGSDGEPYRELWGCGDGSSGQLGAEYLTDVKARQSTSIFTLINLNLGEIGLHGYTPKLTGACWETTYVVLSSDNGDKLISMGADDFGDLGVGGLNKGKGKEASGELHIVNFDHLSVKGLGLQGAQIFFSAISASQHHVVVQMRADWDTGYTKNVVAGWGAARHGQLGPPPPKGATPFFSSSVTLTVADGDDPVTGLALGMQHTLLLHSTGHISGLGSNRKGQLQGLQTVNHVRRIGCTWNGSYVMTEKDGVQRLLATGSHSKGQLGRPVTQLPSDSNVLTLLEPVQFPSTSVTHRLEHFACGSEHLLALFVVGPSSDATAPLYSDEVWGCGWNEHGNLGLDHTEDVHLPVRIWPADSASSPTISCVSNLWAGVGTSWISVVI